MLTAVLSDIHGNWEALKSVFKDIENTKPDKIFCLGDLVGYGPEPERVVNEIRTRDIPTVMGNHELALFDDDILEGFNKQAKKSIEIIRKLISYDTLKYLQKLPSYIVKDDMRFVHGAPPASINDYLNRLNGYDMLILSKKYDEKIAFVGHTHRIRVIEISDTIKEIQYKNRKKRLNKDFRYILNTGSVGQPRDYDNRAKYVLFDDYDYSFKVRRVKYDIKKTADRILELGLPESNAARLWG